MTMIYVPVGRPAAVTNVGIDEMRRELGWVSFAYPFDDEYIALAHDDDGIANGRQPNRTIGSEIMPGPFYVVRIDDEGRLCDLTESDVEKYTDLFSTPEVFPAGRWDVKTTMDETESSVILKIISSWVPEKPVCPLCHKEYDAPPALSRKDNKTAICPDCGIREALTAASIKPELIEKIISATKESQRKGDG